MPPLRTQSQFFCSVVNYTKKLLSCGWCNKGLYRGTDISLHNLVNISKLWRQNRVKIWLPLYSIESFHGFILATFVFWLDRDRTPPRPPPTKIFAFLCKKHVTFQDFPNHNYLQCLGWIATKARDLLACQTVFPLAVFVCCEFMENTNTNVIYSGRYSNSSEGNNCGFAECNVAREKNIEMLIWRIFFF